MKAHSIIVLQILCSLSLLQAVLAGRPSLPGEASPIAEAALNLPVVRGNLPTEDERRNAIPMLPTVAQVPDLPSDQSTNGPPFVVGGNPGGAAAPSIQVPNGRMAVVNGTVGLSGRAYGSGKHPFTTQAANAEYLDPSTLKLMSDSAPTNLFPYRATGKIYFQIGAGWYVCSGSLIGPGLVVTAAHCVCKYGKGAAGLYTNFVFIPAKFDGSSPYGEWAGASVAVPSVYIGGTDSCSTAGVVCENDVAVLTLVAQNGAYPGSLTGWYGYGSASTFMTSFLSNTVTMITALGYPEAFNYGRRMMRTDSLGVQKITNQIQIGTSQTGGSSGGPWLVNFGASYSAPGVSAPLAATPNVVVATTSWGYVDDRIKIQGASRFGTNSKYTSKSNIQTIVEQACNTLPNRMAVCGY